MIFRSLEASRLVAVITARALFSLPYQWARTSQHNENGMINYRSRRFRTGERFELSVRPDHDQLVDDELSAFLTARRALCTARFGTPDRIALTD